MNVTRLIEELKTLSSEHGDLPLCTQESPAIRGVSYDGSNIIVAEGPDANSMNALVASEVIAMLERKKQRYGDCEVIDDYNRRSIVLTKFDSGKIILIYGR